MNLIDIGMQIAFPEFKNYKVLYHRRGKTLIPNKDWKIDVYSSNALLGFDFNLRKDAHEGFSLEFSFLFLSVDFYFYDCRDWNYETNDWEAK